MTEAKRGVLVLVGTPLGNRGDLSPRARETILGADLLLCEDTRSPTRLFGPEVSLPARRSCFVGNEMERVQTMLDALERGQTVVFMSEAGMPVWSDPGRGLVRAAVDAGYDVDVVPGPTAASVALVASGFDAQDARFFGFLPRGGDERARAVGQIAAAPGPSLIYEAGNRVPATLRDLAEALDDAADRPMLVARELTKVHQELLRGSVADLASRVVDAVRGEVTLVVGAAQLSAAPSRDGATAAARGVLDLLLDTGLKPRQRAKAIAALTGLDAREVYDRLTRRSTD